MITVQQKEYLIASLLSPSTKSLPQQKRAFEPAFLKPGDIRPGRGPGSIQPRTFPKLPLPSTIRKLKSDSFIRSRLPLLSNLEMALVAFSSAAFAPGPILALLRGKKRNLLIYFPSPKGQWKYEITLASRIFWTKPSQPSWRRLAVSLQLQWIKLKRIIQVIYTS